MFDLSQLASLSLLEIGSDCFGLADSFDLDGLNQLASVSIGDGSFKNSTSFSLSNLNSFELLEIGNECFSNVGSFELNGLNALKTLKIGQNSFTLNKNDYGENEDRSFLITNCASIESIDIGKFSFSDYAGSFELKELNSLETIRIGTINETSNNFYYAPFNLHGIQLAINDLIQRSSKTHLLLPRRWILRWFSHLYPLELEFLTVDRDRKRMLYENKEIHNRRIERFAIALYRRVLLYKI